ncbi:MAG: aminotransferase class I/II-fold pyridoxal phosphate-dependent enzyme [Legionellaceae bacterium]|nr:aminotransferase class I/II-fold pyridoxal phosphate-dependent enzyme [Legionellaceae bacterium]
MTTRLNKQLEVSRNLRKDAGLHRARKIINPSNYKYNFSSNDYLSLAIEPIIKEFYQDGFSKYPVGSTGSIVVCGYQSSHRSLEKYMAEALGVDDCLLFSSGYAANLSVVSLLASANVDLIIDKSVHASIYDGIKLSGAKFLRFHHNNLNDIGKKLLSNQESNKKNRALITESIFSMSGQISPLQDIAKLTAEADTSLIVDEAHAFGIYGEEGLGGVFNAGLSQDDVPLRVIPFGKAVGASGAIVAGQGLWIEELLQMRPAVYSTAMSPAFAYGLQKTIEYIRLADEKRKKLNDLVKYFQKKSKGTNLKWRESNTPIQQLQLGCPFKATQMTDKLLSHSILCMPIRQPTVSKDETGLRVILNCQHDPVEIDYLFASILS